jgi:hypothetical protein
VNFLTTLTQTMGPEAIQGLIDPLEFTKRLAAAQGIDVLNLVKTQQQVEQQKQEGIEMQKQMSLTNQTAALAGTPLMDPTKNQQLANQISGQTDPQQASQGQTDQLPTAPV